MLVKKAVSVAVAGIGLFFLGAGSDILAGQVKTIDGAGATFPYPIYAKWAFAYKAETGVKMNYQSIGSGGGIKQIKAKTVDFGASDAPLKAEELNESGLMQFPVIIGGVVPVVNLPGIKAGQIKLSSVVLSDIYLGKIKKWNDPRIQKDNPGLNLPNKNVVVVHRSDGSGTTWIFTNFLTKVSPDWRGKVGNGKSVAWPTGMGGKGNEGVASYVSRIKGSIGYVEYAYALQNKLTYIQMKNRAGVYVSPSYKAFQASAANADWAHSKGFYMVLTDQSGENSWPISGASFILMHKVQKNPEKAKAVLKFFDWSYKNGGTMAKDLYYVAIPENVADLVRKAWKEEIKDQAGKIIF